MNKISGIYKITSPSGKIYIGQAIDINRRKRQYSTNKIKLKDQPKLYNSVIKYGFNSHLFEIIEECSVQELNIRERYWQEHYKSVENGLNCIYTGTDILPAIYSKERNKKVSKSLIKAKYHSKVGVKLSRNKQKWVCYISQYGNKFFIGSFSIKEEALSAYKVAYNKRENEEDLSLYYGNKYKSKYLGISYYTKIKRWVFKLKGKHIGTFKTEQECINFIKSNGYELKNRKR